MYAKTLIVIGTKNGDRSRRKSSPCRDGQKDSQARGPGTVDLESLIQLLEHCSGSISKLVSSSF